ncbi:MAG: glycosyltransferase family 2 protein [Candidatus Helarchaeota archaeon]
MDASMIDTDYTVITATLNRGEHIKKAIDSVFKQTILPKEYLILLDAASDRKNLQILLNYKKKYPIIKILYLPNSVGVFTLLNLGVKLAKAKYVLILDDDAELMNINWVELAFQKLRFPKVALVWGTTNKGNYPKHRYSEFIAQAFLCKKEIYLKVGGFPEEFIIYDNEIDFTIRLYIAGFYPYFWDELDVKHEFINPRMKSKKAVRYITFELSNRLFVYWRYYPIYIAFFLSILHIIQVIRRDAIIFKEYFAPIYGVRRFFNEFYQIALKQKRTLPLKRTISICYRQQYPTIIYYLLKTIYR